MIRLESSAIEKKLHKYLIMKCNGTLNPVFSLSEDAPEDVKEYFPIWNKERLVRNVPCEIK